MGIIAPANIIGARQRSSIGLPSKAIHSPEWQLVGTRKRGLAGLNVIPASLTACITYSTEMIYVYAMTVFTVTNLTRG
jgi:hypothetical protein